MHFQEGKALPCVFPWSQLGRKPPTERLPIPPQPKKQSIESQLREQLSIQQELLDEVTDNLAVSKETIQKLKKESESLKKKKWNALAYSVSKEMIKIFVFILDYLLTLL